MRNQRNASRRSARVVPQECSAVSRERRAATSRLYRDRIAYKVNTDAMRGYALVEVGSNSLGNLLLQIAQILPPCRNSARAIRSFPGCY